MSKSNFCGKIDEFPFIRVDNFEHPEEEGIKAYFLSHCHTDHTNGLYRPELIEYLESRGVYIYMTELSAAIVENETKDDRLVKYVRPLPYQHKLITIPGDGVTEAECINVTLLPAGHCAGATMFLFQDGKKTVLYTGDFRMSAGTVEGTSYFHDNKGQPISLDAMYVDTTFIDRRYSTFPRRSESINEILSEISKQVNNRNGRVALHTSAKYGYEYVFNEIYDKLGVQVYVDECRWKFYSKVQHLVPGVTNDVKSTKIHVCWKRENVDHDRQCLPISNIDFKTEQNEYLYIHFSAMIWRDFKEDQLSFSKDSDKRINVCFATHCSRNELMFFVNYFPPTTKKVVGFPNPFVNIVSPVKELVMVTPPLTPKRKKGTTKKDEIKDKKISKDLFSKMFEF